MTETARKIMDLFAKHDKVKAGMVLTLSGLAREAGQWGPQHSAGLEKAMEELRDEGYVIITTPHGLELTENGFSYLFAGL
jgi:peptidoglycan/xylan/chitin deacetylase (PgdA/CDA1 family)